MIIFYRFQKRKLNEMYSTAWQSGVSSSFADIADLWARDYGEYGNEDKL